MKVAIHCSTREEALAVQTQAFLEGKTWNGHKDQRDLLNGGWNEYSTRLCLGIENDGLNYSPIGYYQQNDYEIVEAREYLKTNKPSRKSFMKKLNIIVKKTVDPETQTLLKAGFLNGDLEIEEDGKDALLQLLFLEKKTELSVMAAERLAEEKEDK